MSSSNGYCLNVQIVHDSVLFIGKNNDLIPPIHINVQEHQNLIIGDDCILANNVTLAGHVVIDSHAIIGGLTPIHQFTRIGSYCMVGGASAVNQDICPFVLAEGNKAVVRGLNSIGLRRRGFTDEDVSNLKKAYKILFRQNAPLKEAIEELEKTFSEDKNVMYLVDFIKNSSRGIAR